MGAANRHERSGDSSDDGGVADGISEGTCRSSFSVDAEIDENKGAEEFGK